MFSTNKKSTKKRIAALCGVLGGVPMLMQLGSSTVYAARLAQGAINESAKANAESINDEELDHILSWLENCEWYVTSKTADQSAGDGDNSAELITNMANVDQIEWRNCVGWVQSQVSTSSSNPDYPPFWTVNRSRKWKEEQKNLDNEMGSHQTIEGRGNDKDSPQFESYYYGKDGVWHPSRMLFKKFQVCAAAWAQYRVSGNWNKPEVWEIGKWSPDPDMADYKLPVPQGLGDRGLFSGKLAFNGYYVEENKAKAVKATSLDGEELTKDAGFKDGGNKLVRIKKKTELPATTLDAFNSLKSNISTLKSQVESSLFGEAGVTVESVGSVAEQQKRGLARYNQFLQAQIILDVISKSEPGQKSEAEDAAKDTTNLKYSRPLGAMAAGNAILKELKVTNGANLDDALAIVAKAASGRDVEDESLEDTINKTKDLLSALALVNCNGWLTASTTKDLTGALEANLAKWVENTGEEWIRLRNTTQSEATTAAQVAIQSLVSDGPSNTYTWNNPGEGPYKSGLLRIKTAHETEVNRLKTLWGPTFQGTQAEHDEIIKAAEDVGFTRAQAEHLFATKGKELIALLGAGGLAAVLGFLGGKLAFGGNTPGAAMKDTMLNTDKNKNGAAKTDKTGKLANTTPATAGTKIIKT